MVAGTDGVSGQDLILKQGRIMLICIRALAAKPLPELPAKYRRLEVVRALLVPEIAAGARKRRGECIVVAGRDLIG